MSEYPNHTPLACAKREKTLATKAVVKAATAFEDAVARETLAEANLAALRDAGQAEAAKAPALSQGSRARLRRLLAVDSE